MTPILLLEINEIPWRLIDHYSAKDGFPHLRKFFQNSHQFTSVTVDVGELSPWVTWPTVHRGLSNEEHKIKNLGQDPNTFGGTPIWEEIRAQGGTIGICGSMQSWPPIDPGAKGFYMPDTFAHDESCIPNYLNPMQAFNLSQVRKNARVASTSLPTFTELKGLASALLQSGIKIKTITKLVAQVVGEKFDKERIGRRSTFQSILFWDIFCKHFSPATPPDFSTFFSNHIAGLMHRYWCDIFPGDFPEQNDAGRVSKEHLMDFAFHVLDEMLGEVIRWAQLNPNLTVIFASSMGQAAIHRESHEGFELVVEDLSLIMSNIGLSRADYNPLIAMVPQIAVEIKDASKRKKTLETLEKITCGDSTHFIKVQEIGVSLSITVSTPTRQQLESDVVIIDGNKFTWAGTGIRRQEIEPGTAYHIPEGIVAAYGNQNGHHGILDQNRTKIYANNLKEWMLSINKRGQSEITNIPVFID